MSILSAFVPPFLHSTRQLPCLQPTPSCSLRKATRCLRLPRRQAHYQPTFSRPHACLSPPNSEAHWVIVDVIVRGLSEEAMAPLVSVVEDDAKSLVRTVLRDAPVELSVALTSDSTICTLNSQWRGMDCATDVLSFPQDDPDQVVLGDIVISVETARRQALERGLDEIDEIRILLVHGLLHLLGYDHIGKKEGDWLVMAQTENRFLKQLGWKGEGLVSAAQDPFYKEIVQA